jgi:hypothetical protein
MAEKKFANTQPIEHGEEFTIVTLELKEGTDVVYLDLVNDAGFTFQFKSIASFASSLRIGGKVTVEIFYKEKTGVLPDGR